MTAAMTLTEWVAWLAGQGIPPRLNPPATPAEIAATEQKLGVSFPADLRELYLQANGSEGGLLLGLPLHTLAQLEDAYANWENVVYGDNGMFEESEDEDLYSSCPPGTVQSRYWVRGWIPLCTDGGGNHIAYDLAPAEAGSVGQLINMGPDEDDHIQLARSLAEFWAVCARKVENGELKIEADGLWSTPSGYVAFSGFRKERRGLL
ncbi:SMI1/KNR4 family protein [Deinococcus sp. VB343]|uniref:SMI1/KNR4 family protein n=1 Tax=Deinococcus sp. VB142 TaxID=3112952 RepID=A0AAU6Q0B1_9DEIO|nr:SMI1/KNR4 family protein [Deinococcus sp.]MDO4245022.1 SMI1/KNR4 family protein [Deinococcus sp.]